MSDIGDLTVGIKCDPSDLTAGMTQVREQINETTTTIVLQETTWRHFSETVIGSIAKIAVPVLRLVNTYKQIQLATIALTIAQTAAIPPTLTLAGAMGFLLSPITLIVGAVALAGAALYYFSGQSDAAAASTEKVSESAEEAETFVSRLSSAFDSLSNATIGEQATQDVRSAVGEYGNLQKSIDKLRETIAQPFLDAGAALQSYAHSILPISSAADAAADAMRRARKAIDDLIPSTKQGSSAWAAFALSMATGLPTAAAAELIDVGGAINAQQAVINKLTEQREGFGALGEIQRDAAAAAERAAEVAKISSIVTLEGINEQILALQQRAAAVILAGNADDAWKEQTKALFDALEKQRQGIVNGTVVDRAAEDAKKALAKAEEDAAKAAQRAADEEKRKTDSGIEKIANLQDQVDLLSGAATKAQIAMRQMTREGFSEEHAERVGKLTEELERLEEEKNGKKKDKDGGRKDATSAAVTAGSKEALSIIAQASSASKDPMLAKADKQIQQQANANVLLENLPEKINKAMKFQVADIA